ncbi:histidine phosphatase superfamily [Geopyxis carbonaria]|nr:histidine phosphatase superfamily [Geopyxis carbonaria]
MAPKLITLVRHGQAHHNVDEKYHLRDPLLTPLGESQCRSLHTRFPSSPPIDLIATSPLKRTLQTSLLGFSDALAAGTPLIALAELQETANLPCDTGSPAAELAAIPEFAHIDFSGLPEDWTSKAGRWSAEPDALKKRATWVRRWLLEREEAHVVCVLHGGFLHHLTEDWTGHGVLPGTGWSNTEFRTYTFKEGSDSLLETEESRRRRSDKPLGRTELKQVQETVGANA